jgi:chorismate synthase
MEIEHRIIADPTDFERVVDLEITVWGLHPRDAVPASMLRAIQHGGGLVSGAFSGDQIVGLVVAFPVLNGGKPILWSHMTAVHPAYQKAGIGVELKFMQRAWALQNDFDEIRWTFDPLQRGNAHFNLRKLGATFETYLVNFYGTMTDAINQGMPSDRVEAVWRLNDARVIALAAGQAELFGDSANYPALLLCDERGLPGTPTSIDPREPRCMAQIPPSLNALLPDAVMAWRLALRGALQAAFNEGYAAVDFDPLRSAYILHKTNSAN